MATQLHRPKAWATRLFGEESQPHTNTIDRWIKNNVVKTQKFAGVRYIEWDFETMDLTDLQANQMLKKIRGKKAGRH